MKRSAFKPKVYERAPSGRQWEGDVLPTARHLTIRVESDSRGALNMVRMAALLKFPYERSPTLLANCRKLRCQDCGAPPPSTAAHSNWAVHGKGRSIKASDIYIAALCVKCHRELDQGSHLLESERKLMWWHAHVKTIESLLRLKLWPQRHAIHGGDIPIPNTSEYPW